MTPPGDGAAQLPPRGLDGLDPACSRLVHVPDVDGVGRTFHVLDRTAGGDGADTADPPLTLLCVHGNPTWSYLFRELLARAPDGVRVVAVDQLDMGFSERTGTVRRLATRVDDLDALTDELGITGPVVTVAHDWGGPISLGWALRHHDRLAGVVLMNTAVHQPAGSPAPNLIRLARSRPVLRNVTVRTDTFVRGTLRLSRPQPPADVREAFLAPYRTADRRGAIAEFVADIPLEPEHPSAATLDAIAGGLGALADVPVLLLWGAADPVFSDRYLHDLERRLPHADVHRHPRASHLVSEDVDAFGAVIDWVGARSLGSDPAPTPATRASTLLDTHAHLGTRPAVVETTGDCRRVDFGDFAGQVERTARGLEGIGVRPGDRVALMVPPGVDLAVSLFACWQAGAVIVLVDSGLGPSGMSAAMRAANPEHLIGVPKALAAARALRWPGRPICTIELDAARRRALGAIADVPSLPWSSGELPPPPSLDDVAAVVFTSGATGPSKGVVYTHGRLEAQRDALVDLYDITHDDRLVAAFAPFALYGPAMGISSVVPDMDVAAPGTLTAAALGDAAVAVDATMVFASPAALANVVRTASQLTAGHRRAFERVRLLLSAGAPVRPSLLRAAAGLFPNAVARTPYGMTECLPVADIDLTTIDVATGDAATGDGGVCVGRPVPGVDVRIRPLDELGRARGGLTSAPDVVGEVVVRAAHARAGYDRLWHTEFRASQPAGWHATGDVGHLDAAGRLWIGGRLGHVIATAAGPLTPVRPEQAIESIDGVAMAAVVGVGPVGIQQVVAVVERESPARRPRVGDLALTDRVRAVVGAEVAAVFEVPELPVDRRHNSKIDRARVAAWAERALAGGRLGTP